MIKSVTVVILSMLVQFGCQAQTNNKMSTMNNPLLCDPIKGSCEISFDNNLSNDDHAIEQLSNKPVKIIYFTDPICSSCWGIEPQLRKLKLEYGDFIHIEYRMGGLLPDWSYNSGGISKPSDVAHHWDEVSKYYQMPIDGDVWLEDPLASSYPPSIAFKAAQLQNETKAIQFLRRIREMVFLEKKNITKWEHLRNAANDCGLDTAKLESDFKTKAKELFSDDLLLARRLGVRGFPTLIFEDQQSHKQVLNGFKPYHVFEQTVVNLYPPAVKQNYNKSWASLFDKFKTLTTREFSELANVPQGESEKLLQMLVDEKKLIKQTTKNGPIWMKIGS